MTGTQSKSILPAVALPPEEQIGPNLLGLASIIVDQLQELPINRQLLSTWVLEILPLLCPFDDMTGLALAAGEKTYKPDSSEMPMVCVLANYFVDLGYSEIAQLVKRIKTVMRSAVV